MPDDAKEAPSTPSAKSRGWSCAPDPHGVAHPGREAIPGQADPSAPRKTLDKPRMNPGLVARNLSVRSNGKRYAELPSIPERDEA
jgi:hypothetical protein